MSENLVTVKNIESQEVLFTCSIEELESAYQYAVDMEKLGLNIVVDAPTLTTTLAAELGVQGEDLKEFDRSVREELENHDASSCAQAASSKESSS